LITFITAAETERLLLQPALAEMPNGFPATTVIASRIFKA
jgi:hypothetical protein